MPEDLQRLLALRAGRRGTALLMTEGNLVWQGWGAGGGTGQSPEGGAGGGQGERAISEREEVEERGVGERVLGTGVKGTCFFFIATNAENESLIQAWGSRILFVCLYCLRVCLCDVGSREF